jgi:hypothetical protein
MRAVYVANYRSSSCEAEWHKVGAETPSIHRVKPTSDRPVDRARGPQALTKTG